MQIAGLILGILSFLFWVVAVIPLLGWINWLNIPLAGVGLALSIIGVVNTKGSRTAGIIGITLCSVAIIFGIARLKVGCGII